MNRAPSDASALLETVSRLASYPQQNTKKKKGIDRVAFNGQFNFQLFFAACDVDLLLMQLHPSLFCCEENETSYDTPGQDATGRLTVCD